MSSMDFRLEFEAAAFVTHADGTTDADDPLHGRRGPNRECTSCGSGPEAEHVPSCHHHLPELEESR